MSFKLLFSVFRRTSCTDSNPSPQNCKCNCHPLKPSPLSAILVCKIYFNKLFQRDFFSSRTNVSNLFGSTSFRPLGLALPILFLFLLGLFVSNEQPRLFPSFRIGRKNEKKVDSQEKTNETGSNIIEIPL